MKNKKMKIAISIIVMLMMCGLGGCMSKSNVSDTTDEQTNQEYMIYTKEEMTEIVKRDIQNDLYKRDTTDLGMEVTDIDGIVTIRVGNITIEECAYMISNGTWDSTVEEARAYTENMHEKLSEKYGRPIDIAITIGDESIDRYCYCAVNGEDVYNIITDLSEDIKK